MDVVHILSSSEWYFCFNDAATTEIYTLSLHDALPIYDRQALGLGGEHRLADPLGGECRSTRRIDPQHQRLQAAAAHAALEDRKSTRLNSSHANISYAVFCLKKKNGRAHL